MDNYRAKFDEFIANINKETIYNSVIGSLNELQQDRTSTASLSFLFNIANYIVLPAWILMALLPKSSLTSYAVKFALLLNCFLYVSNIVPIMLQGSLDVDFTTFEGVLTLFKTGSSDLLLACWIHYLAFDLIVGYYVARDAANSGINRLLVLPFLFVTLMVGPFGFLLWTICRRTLLGAKGKVLSFDMGRQEKKPRYGLKME
jgi:hypothetical protein